jgi:hypothetical protein
MSIDRRRGFIAGGLVVAVISCGLGADTAPGASLARSAFAKPGVAATHCRLSHSRRYHRSQQVCVGRLRTSRLRGGTRNPSVRNPALDNAIAPVSFAAPQAAATRPQGGPQDNGPKSAGSAGGGEIGEEVGIEITPEPEPEPTPEPEPEPTPEPDPEPDPEPAPSPEPEEEAPEAPPANSPLIFDGDFGLGLSQWHQQALPGRIVLNSGPPFKSMTAARFEVREGDIEPETGSNRAEVSGPTFDEGDDIFVRDAIRIPSADTHSSPWQLVNQLHETDWGGSPGIAVMLDNDLHLSLSAGDGSPAYWHGPALATDRWYEIVYRVKLSQDSSQGFVEIWLDGAPQQLENGSTRMYGETIQTQRTYLKVGIYRAASSTGTSIVEHAGVAVSGTLGSFLQG